MSISLEVIKKNDSNLYPIISTQINISGLLNDLKLINLDNGDIFNSEPIDIIILSSFDGRLTIGEVINTLAESYEYDESCKVVFTILTKYKDLITWSTNRSDMKNQKSCSALFDIKKFKFKKADNEKIEFPNIISLFLTDKCNFNCKYCYRVGIKREGSINPSKVLEIIDEAYENKAIKINFTGGEPLLDKKIICYIKKCIEYKIFPFISTNGYLLSQDVLEKLLESRLPMIQISFDSLSQDIFKILCGFDGLQTVKNNIVNIANSKLKITMRTVLCKLNFHELKNIIEFANSLGVYKLVITPIALVHNKMTQQDMLFLNYNEVREAKNIALKYSQSMNISFQIINKCWNSHNDIMSCGALFSSTNILSNGDITLCSNLPQYIYGNIYTHSVKEAWNSELFENIRNNLVDKNYVSYTCSECEYYNSCYTGCPSLKSAAGLDFNAMDPRCFKFKTKNKYFYNEFDYLREEVKNNGKR